MGGPAPLVGTRSDAVAAAQNSSTRDRSASPIRPEPRTGAAGERYDHRVMTSQADAGRSRNGHLVVG
ncbi:hypothetical protein GCM10020366_22690 [Saccharopolyspora gregorii]|uniref:Uncharacterized protein n=1 Tax=Saccharopolyspora gregorii TaxID=33914 RepID=A0ABP6RP58_9PSEU